MWRALFQGGSRLAKPSPTLGKSSFADRDPCIVRGLYCCFCLRAQGPYSCVSSPTPVHFVGLEIVIHLKVTRTVLLTPDEPG